jgi:hypothetical protein
MYQRENYMPSNSLTIDLEKTTSANLLEFVTGRGTTTRRQEKSEESEGLFSKVLKTLKAALP